MRLISLLRGKIIGVREEENIIELIIEKNGKKIRVRFYPDVDYTYSSCTFEDEDCYDLVQLYDVEEV